MMLHSSGIITLGTMHTDALFFFFLQNWFDANFTIVLHLWSSLMWWHTSLSHNIIASGTLCGAPPLPEPSLPPSGWFNKETWQPNLCLLKGCLNVSCPSVMTWPILWLLDFSVHGATLWSMVQHVTVITTQKHWQLPDEPAYHNIHNIPTWYDW